LKSLKYGVIGSGISGLSAAWLLSQRHDVTLIEADHRLGGHSHTIDVRLKDGSQVPVDTGFIVSNTSTYPNFTGLMSYLDVTMSQTKMTFSVSAENGRFEYSGDSLLKLLGGARQWADPRHWRLIADLVRFYRTAESHAPEVPAGVTLGQYLERHNYSRRFIDRHILPIAGAIWSSGPQEIARFPFHAFVTFFANHKLFMFGDRPHWSTVRGGSREYVRNLVDDGKFRSVTGVAVSRVDRSQTGVVIHGGNNFREQFDEVVIATHADQALRMLGDPSVREQALLSVFKTSSNRVVVHRDATLMPRSRRFWSAWNYMAGDKGHSDLSVTYWMNALQSLNSTEQHFVTLNPRRDPAPDLVDRELTYHHPVFTPETLAAQHELWSLQGRNRTWFAGAWFGAGFHEDGLQAGLAVAEQLGGMQRPWTVADESGRIHVKPVAPRVLPSFTEAAE
jgi:uncharacterized protein